MIYRHAIHQIKADYQGYLMLLLMINSSEIYRNELSDIPPSACFLWPMHPAGAQNDSFFQKGHSSLQDTVKPFSVFEIKGAPYTWCAHFECRVHIF